MSYVCDCGRSYADLNGIDGCQASNHRRPLASPLHDYEQFVVEVWGSAVNTHLTQQQLANLYVMTAGLGGETGEVLEKLKKYVRDGALDKAALLKELGDTLYYLTRIAAFFDFTLAEVMGANMEKLRSRRARGVMRGSGDER